MIKKIIYIILGLMVALFIVVESLSSQINLVENSHAREKGISQRIEF